MGSSRDSNGQGTDLGDLVKRSGVNLSEGVYIAEAGKKTKKFPTVDQALAAFSNSVEDLKKLMDSNSAYTKPTLVADNSKNNSPSNQV